MIAEIARLEPVVQKISPGSRLLRTWQLSGGISAQTCVLEIQQADGRLLKVVLRQPAGEDMRKNAALVETEFRLLQALQPSGLPAPRPYFFDPSGALLPAPYLILEFIEGQPEFAPADPARLVQALAQQLARIHAVAIASGGFSFLPTQAQLLEAALARQPAAPDESLHESRLRQTLAAAWPRPRRNDPALLHGDYWPGNILWHAGEIVAIIDWEDAQIGDPAADVANGRLEILFAYGAAAMQRFTAEVRARRAIDLTDLPFWDLWAAIRLIQFPQWVADKRVERRLRARYHRFVAAACQAWRRADDVADIPG